MKCRHCNQELQHCFSDLGFSPPSNSYLTKEALSAPEKFYPLRVFVCEKCFLVQTEDFAQADEFFSSEYAYFSSVSSSWNQHCLLYEKMITKKLDLDSSSFVVELASNDGYLLRYFQEDKIPCLGIEPTKSTARAAREFGLNIVEEFFTQKLAEKLLASRKEADLIIGNNVYAHVPDINDFTNGMKVMLKKGGTITLEFPHLLNLIEKLQFDTIYHEHFSYLSLFSVCKIFEKFGLRIFDVEEIATHGGSLRIYGCHRDDARKTETSVENLLQKEKNFGLLDLKLYLGFQSKIEMVKNNFLMFLLEQKRSGKRVVAYGAAAKGNTLLNFAGVKPDLLPFVCDAALSKIGKFMPGSHIPIFPPEKIRDHKPDYVLILPWNISSEVKSQLSFISEWDGKFVVAIPGIAIMGH